MKPFLHIPVLALVLLAASSQCFALQETVETEEQSRAAALGFLADLPELKGVSLQMSEKEFLKLMEQRKLRYERDAAKGDVSYYVRIPGKERDANVYFGFRDGLCSGIQRLQPGPKK